MAIEILKKWRMILSEMDLIKFQFKKKTKFLDFRLAQLGKGNGRQYRRYIHQKNRRGQLWSQISYWGKRRKNKLRFLILFILTFSSSFWKEKTLFWKYEYFKEDLTGAAIGLLRLQDTYRLDTHDLAEGRIYKEQGNYTFSGQFIFFLKKKL